MSAHLVNDYGVIQIKNEVINIIASNAAMELYGVVGLVNANATESILSLLKNDNLSKGVLLSINENKISLDLHVILEYGVNISAVCENIIDTIKYKLEENTGIKVNRVNVIVRDIKLQNQEDI